MAVRKQSDAVHTQEGPAEVAGSQIVNGLQTLLGGMLLKGPLGGAGMELVVNEEEIALDPNETTTYSTKKLLPADSILLGLTARVTEEIIQEEYAVGALSIDGSPVADESFSIGGQRFTFKPVRTKRGEIDGFDPVGYAAGKFTLSGELLPGDKLSVGSTEFTCVPVRSGAREISIADGPQPYAKGTLEVTGPAVLGAQFTVGSGENVNGLMVTYSRAVPGEVAGYPDPRARGTFHVVGPVVENDTFTLGSDAYATVFVFKNSPTLVTELAPGATPAETAANMIAAIVAKWPVYGWGSQFVASLAEGTTDTVHVIFGTPGSDGLAMALASSTASIVPSGEFMELLPPLSASELVDAIIAAFNENNLAAVASRVEGGGNVVHFTSMVPGAAGDWPITIPEGTTLFVAGSPTLTHDGEFLTAPLLAASIADAINTDLSGVVTAVAEVEAS